VKEQLAGQEMELVVTDAAKDAIIAKGYDQAYGARPLRREIQNQIEDALAERMLQATFAPGDIVTVDVGPDGALVIEKEAPAKRQPAKAGPVSGRYVRGKRLRGTDGAGDRSFVGSSVPAVKTTYLCQQCGSASPKWAGQCPSCGAWNTLVETMAAPRVAVVRHRPREPWPAPRR
jgi:lipopolysaccharide biosynthesis regulator YciM